MESQAGYSRQVAAGGAGLRQAGPRPERDALLGSCFRRRSEFGRAGSCFGRFEKIQSPKWHFENRKGSSVLAESLPGWRQEKQERCPQDSASGSPRACRLPLLQRFVRKLLLSWHLSSWTSGGFLNGLRSDRGQSAMTIV